MEAGDKMSVDVSLGNVETWGGRLLTRDGSLAQEVDHGSAASRGSAQDS